MGDLGSESGRNVSKLLTRVLKRQKKSRKLSCRGQEDSSLSATRLGSNLQCGARAVVDRIDQDQIQEEKACDSEWEDVSSDDQAEREGNDHGSLVVALEKPDNEVPRQRAKRQAFTQEDKIVCQTIHRSHALCLLARGMLYDAVVRDDLLHGAVVSLVPQESLVGIQEKNGPLSISALEGLVKYFHEKFKVRESIDGMNIDALKMDYGTEDAVSNLLKGIRDAECTAEELSVIFASLMDVLGYPVRTVRHLDPCPLKPGDVVKRMKQQALQSAKKLTERKRKTSKKKESKGAGMSPKADAPQGTVKKSDLEYEREMALAIEATSWVAPEDRPGTSNTQADDKNSVNQRTGLFKRKKGTSAGAVVSKTPGGVGQFWVEVYCGDAKDGQWIHCDPAAGWVNRAEDVEQMTNRTGALVYVVAFCGGGAKDVTRRYSSNFVSSQKQRDTVWWTQTMSLLRSKGKEISGKSLTGLADCVSVQPWLDLITEREDKELDQKVTRELKALPTTIEGFKNHVDYVLKRHVGKYQILVPGAEVVGMHKGEPYYLRRDLVDIHTADRWRRLGREVKRDELDRPCKKIKKRGAPKVPDIRSPDSPSGIDIDEGNDQLMSRYYAEWQTVPWTPPPAIDGKVPKNERGNVEAPPFAAELPKGTVHVQLPQIAKICKKIGIDFAPALTGFDIRGGRSVPRVDGVVICKEFEDLVRDAYAEDVKHQAQVAKVQRLKDGEMAWKDLLKATLTHYRVKKSYANDDASMDLLQHASLKKDPGMKNHPLGSDSRPKNKHEESLMVSQDQVEMEEI